MSVSTDEDLIILNEHAFDIECDWGKPDGPEHCEQAAVWSARLSCCGRVYLWCDYHLKLQQDIINKKKVLDPVCGATDIHIINVEPINKSK